MTEPERRWPEGPERIHCWRCPCFFAMRDWDGPARYLPMTRKEKTAEGVSRDVDVFDADGKPVYRKDPEGRPIELGTCTVAGPDPRWIERGGSLFPVVQGMGRCECPDKRSAIERLGLREYGEA